MFIYNKNKYKYPTTATINLTNDCNLQCKYCFVEQHPEYMDFETAKKIADWLYQNLLIARKRDKKRKAYIVFFGGEPLLQYNTIIVPLVEYIEEKYPKDFVYSITTNGTLLDHEKIMFLKKYDIFPMLSMDGEKTVQDNNRPCKNQNLSSFDLISKNIPFLLENFPYMTFRATFSKETVSNIFETYLFAELCGFKKFYIMPNHRDNWDEDNIKIFKEEIKKIFIHRINQFKNNIYPMEFSLIDQVYKIILKHDVYQMNKNTDKIVNETFNPLLGCGLGTSSVSIGPDGKFYGCQEQPSKENKNIFYIGDIDKGIDKKRHKLLLKRYISNQKNNKIICSNQSQCVNCPLKGYCHTMRCVSTSYDLYQNLNTLNEIRCIQIKEFFINCIAEMKILTLENNLFFKEYIKKQLSFLPIILNNKEESGKEEEK